MTVAARRCLAVLAVAAAVGIPDRAAQAAAPEPPGTGAATASEAGSTVPVDQSAERERIARAFGWDFEETAITPRPLTDGLSVLFGAGGNVLVSVGEDGVLMVDDQLPQMAPKLLAAIEALGGGGVDFVINTHWHFDHADGNETFGPGGAWLVSQANSRQMMRRTHVVDLVGIEYTQRPYPRDALPVITFDRAMQFHFNGERIDLLHFGPAHTTGDAAVIFRDSNVVHMGDVFNNAGYPFIDVGNGGDLDGVIAFCRAVLERIDDGTMVVPGHGPVADYETMKAYVTMLQTVRDRVARLVGKGADLDTVLAARPTREFDERYGDPAEFVDRAYFSLAGAGKGTTD